MLARLILGRTTKLGENREGGSGTSPVLLKQLLKRGGCYRTIKKLNRKMREKPRGGGIHPVGVRF